MTPLGCTTSQPQRIAGLGLGLWVPCPWALAVSWLTLGFSPRSWAGAAQWVWEFLCEQRTCTRVPGRVGWWPWPPEVPEALARMTAPAPHKVLPGKVRWEKQGAPGSASGRISVCIHLQSWHTSWARRRQSKPSLPGCCLLSPGRLPGSPCTVSSECRLVS